MEKDSASPKTPVPIGGPFNFDGSTSDLAQLLYRRYSEGGVIETLNIDESKLPERIQERLKKTGSSFSVLPGILQRALVWDSGYALDSDGNFIPIKTLGGRSMADIAVTAEEFTRGAGCKTLNCMTPTGVITQRSHICTGNEMMNVTKCMADDGVTNPVLHSIMWGLGSDPKLTPEITIKHHSWIDDSSMVNYSVYAIHTEKTIVPYGSCPIGHDAFVIPCSVMSFTNTTTRARMSEPQTSAWVDTLLVEFPKSSMLIPAPAPTIDTGSTISNKSGISAGVVAGISVGVLVLIGLIIVIVARKRRRNSSKDITHREGSVDPNPLLVLGANHAGAVSASQAEVAARYNGLGAVIGRQSEDNRSSSSDAVLRALLTNPNLVARQLVYEKLSFKKMLSKGAYGEVWMCTYEGQDVAVKRLLQTKHQTFEQVRNFTSEIQLTASLQHPNVIAFVGVAWTSLENLVMALEYLPRGDLQSYLKTNAELLSWARDKVHMALGIARALEYIHSRSPPLIHRDIKSKNVLLTERLDAKLIDFGVSRDFQLEEMTAGVGTPYWTAPEVLESTTYSERSDIFSFGVMLSEIDTCELPYFDAKDPSGEKLKPFKILSSVMAGTLQPSFTLSCPPSVREMAVACLARDPAERPSASELVKMLERF